VKAIGEPLNSQEIFARHSMIAAGVDEDLFRGHTTYTHACGRSSNDRARNELLRLSLRGRCPSLVHSSREAIYQHQRTECWGHHPKATGSVLAQHTRDHWKAQMPNSITDQPPADVAAQVAAYVDPLDHVIPAKQNQNLLIGTWNVRAFNRLTPKWRSVSGESPLRDLSNVLCIGETLRRFDVVAVQEVGPDPEALMAALEALGSGWAFLLTDVVLGDLGHSERLAFVFDQRRLRPSGLACELVVAPEEAGVSTDVLGRQFARTPYAVSFARGESVFTLVTLHVIYGNIANDRVGELRKIAGWMAGWAQGGDVWGENLIALGDFNIDRQVDENGDVDELYKAFIETGLMPPDNLNHVPRTIFDDPIRTRRRIRGISTIRSRGSREPRWTSGTLASSTATRACSTSRAAWCQPITRISSRSGCPITSHSGSNSMCRPPERRPGRRASMGVGIPGSGDECRRRARTIKWLWSGVG
jgi:hypothetical protein